VVYCESNKGSCEKRSNIVVFCGAATSHLHLSRYFVWLSIEAT